MDHPFFHANAVDDLTFGPCPHPSPDQIRPKFLADSCPSAVGQHRKPPGWRDVGHVRPVKTK